MSPFARPARRQLLSALTVAASTLALHAATAHAATPAPTFQLAPRATPAANPPTAETTLKRLPADTRELTFRGESASRGFTVQLGRSEAARTTLFQMSVLNAVSLLPERSIIKLTVNGTVLASLQAGSPDKPTLTPIRIPPGLLVPGTNTVRISTVLSHRVDCSVQATYELWAMLEPTQTGFVVPRDAAAPIRSLDDLALEPPATDGTTRIHLRTAEQADATSLAEAAATVNAIVRRANLVRPVVDVGPDRGTGPGFDVVVSEAGGVDRATEGLSVLARSGTTVIGRDGASNRLVVVVDGAAAVASAPAAASQARPPVPAQGIVKAGFRKSFAELGLPTEAFSGRHYVAGLDIALPPDFLASNDRARLLLDGSHGASLVEGDGLVFRVNGTLVSSMALASGKAEHFQHAIVELPLRFFHPGHNEIAIEGTTSATADAQCDTATMSREPRLTIAGTSELDFPSFAHLATLPQIPAALAYDANGRDGATHLYLPEADRAMLGAGFTVLANMAASQDRIGAPQIHMTMPADIDPPGIVVAAAADLPERFTAAVNKVRAPLPAPAETIAGGDMVPMGVDDPEASPADTALRRTFSQTPSDDAQPVSPMASGDVAAKASTIVATVQSLLRDRGFFFAGDQKSAILTPAADGLLVTAVAPHVATPVVAGVALPYVTRDAAHWLLVTAADRDITQAGLTQLISNGRWSALAGEAVSLDPKTGAVQVLQPRTVSYALPERFVLQDVRPILGGVMSDNIVLSVGVMLVLLTILGVSTHVVIRRMGVR